MKRKTLLAILAVVAAVLTYFKEQFGLAIDATAIVFGIGAVLLYILWEAKRDLKAIAQQKSKWTDGKFWIGFVAILLASLNEQFGINLPAEIIIAVLTFIMGFLFKFKFQTT